MQNSKKFLEGSMAIAEVVKLCRPQVISAYPITPQTHIVEHLSQMVANGEINAEFVNVESEFSAASVVLGASATGARTYTATTSQGLALMAEVLFNIAGMRLPVILTCANRALSSPLNIWNDQQDSMLVRDSGWIQLYAEDTQEAVDMHIQAYKLAEDHEILLPVMVCMDGFRLTHTFEPVEIPSQEEVDKFLPSYKPLYYLTPKNPLTFGAFAEPDKYMETRYMIHDAQKKAKNMIEKIAEEFEKSFGRYSGGLIEGYKIEDAEIVLVSMGSIIGTFKEVADEMREKGRKVGVLKVRSFRPFPDEGIYNALKDVDNIAVFDKNISLGSEGILCSEIKSAFCNKEKKPRVNGFIFGLGGRDISKDRIKEILGRIEKEKIDIEFVDLKKEIIGGIGEF